MANSWFPELLVPYGRFGTTDVDYHLTLTALQAGFRRLSQVHVQLILNQNKLVVQHALGLHGREFLIRSPIMPCCCRARRQVPGSIFAEFIHQPGFTRASPALCARICEE